MASNGRWTSGSSVNRYEPSVNSDNDGSASSTALGMALVITVLVLCSACVGIGYYLSLMAH